MYKETQIDSLLYFEQCLNTSLKVLFIHNAVPEYRIAFWRELSKFCDLTILVTRKDLESKIYGLNKNIFDLNIIYLNAKIVFELIYGTVKTDVVVLPPADTVREWGVGYFINFLCKLKGVKVIYWTEKWEADKSRCPIKKRIKNAIQRKIIGSLAVNSSICIAAGSKSMEYLQKIHVRNDKIRIVYDSSTSPEPVKEIDFEKEFGISKAKKVILYFGRIIRRKGIMVLLEAFRRIQNQNVVLMICGEGDYEKECKAYVVSHNMKNVIFVGKIQPDIRKNFYLRADVFVIPSYTDRGVVEAWGLTVNEALEVGTPVVATTAVGSAFDLLSDLNGVIIEEACVEELYKKLMYMINNRTINRETIKKSYISFSVEEMAKAFANAIKDSVQKWN